MNMNIDKPWLATWCVYDLGAVKPPWNIRYLIIHNMF